MTIEGLLDEISRLVSVASELIGPAPRSIPIISKREVTDRLGRKSWLYRAAPPMRGRAYPCNGDREVARRLRQITAGQITRGNGLAA